ncbi:MAG: hypothetical protein ACE37H_15970 [Phycisphaeraceae bacterium]
MVVRKKGRSKFIHSGQEFVWWVDNDTFIRIASGDKALVVAYLIYDVPSDVGGILAVHGPKFPGIERTEKRPIWLVVPQEIMDAFQQSIGAVVNALISWCLDPEHEIIRYNRNVPAFLGIGDD